MKKMWLIIFFLSSIHMNRCMQPKGVQPEGEKSKLKISPSLDRVKKQGQNNNEVEIFSKKPIFHYKNDFSHKK